ncbi:MAG: ATP-binding protein [Methanospirillaceae archaeon]|nr:ATP-binding protein [Methanospirillaceae archaeon]
MQPLRLPTGIQSFVKIRTQGYAYVDKTPFISALVKNGSYYFLSRPRRFGKSLFVDTLDCAFSGKRELFSGLYLDTDEAGWDFTRIEPVLRIDFAGGSLRSVSDLTSRLTRILDEWENQYKTGKTSGSPGDRLLSLIPKISQITGRKVVILVDEYDKPILDTINHPLIAIEMRDNLKDFYGAIKPLDPYLSFVFMTGVSKFAKAGIFSDLNNLNDITIDCRYSAICGYTQVDLERVFSDRLDAFDTDEVKEWYNGYSWTGDAVYNPFDILLLFDKGVFRPYWFETGTPTFLMKLWKTQPRLPAEYDGLKAGDELLGSFDPEHIRIETLLFQAGYLTIQSFVSNPDEGTWYTLGFPNREVREAFCRQILILLRDENEQGSLQEIRKGIELADTDQLRDILHGFFASIPHDNYRKNQISHFEGFYASVIYTCFASLGYEVIPEDTTNKGRIDLTVKTKTGIWIFEFKVLGIDKSGEKSPLIQIKDKRYAEKYRSGTVPVHEIGIVFNPDTRNIERWEVG